MKKCRAKGCPHSVLTPYLYCIEHRSGGVCSVPGCGRRISRNLGLCYKHYRTREQKLDDKLGRFMRFVEIDHTTGCWNWHGGKSKGYGMFNDGECSVHAHVFSYIMHRNEVPNRLYISCGNRACCNPEHMTSKPPKRKTLAKRAA